MFLKRSENPTIKPKQQIGRHHDHYGRKADAVRQALQSPGHGGPVELKIRSRTESVLGVGLSSARVHSDIKAHEATRALNAKAFTSRNNIWLGKGQSPGDTALMAHELAHVVQQQGGRENFVQASLLDDAMELQEKAHKLTHKGFNLIYPPARPSRSRKLRQWKRRPDVKNYQKAYQLALKIMALVPKAGTDLTLHNDIETRAQMVASDLAAASFVDEAMAIAAKMGTNVPAQIKKNPKKLERFQKKDDELKALVYKPIISQAAKVDEKHLKKISTFYNRMHRNPAKHPVLSALTAGKCQLAQKVGWDKVKVILEAIMAGYQDRTKLIDPISKLLIFIKKYRQKFSKWMWGKEKSFLFSVLNSKGFIEPGYGESIYPHQKPLSLKRDFPWVYTWKQKYYVEYLIKLCQQAKRKDPSIKVPPALRLSVKPGVARKKNFAKVKAWLEKHTNTLGKALGVLYPNHPDKIRDVYHKIGDIFFHHVDQGHVKASRFGSLTKLGRGAPGMRIKADCDVLAAYAARLMRHAGFTALGYLLILSCDPKRSHHASALLKKGSTYYVVSNKNTYALRAATLPDAKQELHQTTLKDAYHTPYPKHFTQYHQAGTKGELPANYLPRSTTIKGRCKLQTP